MAAGRRFKSRKEDCSGIDYSAIDDQGLNKDDNLLDVLEELTPIAKKADKLGIALGLSAESFDPTMQSVVQTWLDQDYNTQRHQLPSYRRLVKAVASKVGGSNPALAKEIAANHSGAVASDDLVATSLPTAPPLLVANEPLPIVDSIAKTETDGPSEAIQELIKRLFRKKRELPPYLRPYPMNSTPHGICLIINNKKIDGKEEREGSDRDETTLSQLFSKLGYKLHEGIVHSNRSSDEMISLVKAVANINHSQYDSVVLFLASHGEAGSVRGSDNQKVAIDIIQSILTDCETLVGKPKIVFVQSCRGTQLPDSKRVQTDGDDPVFIPRDSDFFFGYATTPDTKACRFTDDGSWYVIELCKIMEQYYTQLDLHHMVTAVHHEVATKEEYVFGTTDKTGKKIKYKQSPQIVTTLTRPVYFKLDS